MLRHPPLSLKLLRTRARVPRRPSAISIAAVLPVAPNVLIELTAHGAFRVIGHNP